MKRIVSPLVSVLLLVTASPVARAQGGDLDISLANGTERERQVADQLRRLVAEYDVARWIFTTDVVIDEKTIPHSHPVLTLHTRHLNDDLAELSTFLHEQFHWLTEERPDRTAAAMAEFRDRFPDAPAGGTAGARDRESTYLHLVVCDLELQAMTALVGADAARRVLGAWDHYTWIYDRVLHDPAVRDVTRRHGLVVP